MQCCVAVLWRKFSQVVCVRSTPGTSLIPSFDFLVRFTALVLAFDSVLFNSVVRFNL